MRLLLSFALVALPATAVAEDASPGTDAPAPQRGDRHETVIGGTIAPSGKWPDAAAVTWSGEQACTGTLVAPTVVVTAGHCILGGAPNGVLLNAVSETNPAAGERIRIARSIEYPSSQRSVDAAILILDTPATTPPRAIATGWARFDIKNGAQVALVGFGTTDRDGNIDSPSLMEATTTITDASCTSKSGCNSGARPDGELGAGGDGIDTCPGDSGGPLYLLTPYGDFLAGITSRGYSDNYYYCSEGGIYGRADKIADWIEQTAGVPVKRGPEPSVPLLTAVRGTPVEATITTNDPKAGARHSFAIVTQPQYARAAVSGDGTLRVCPNADVVGGDTVTVSVTDADVPNRAVTKSFPILIEDGEPDDSCDPEAFGEFGGGGCCDTRRSATGSLPLALFVAVVLRRRRRSR